MCWHCVNEVKILEREDDTAVVGSPSVGRFQPVDLFGQKVKNPFRLVSTKNLDDTILKEGKISNCCLNILC